MSEDVEMMRLTVHFVELVHRSSFVKMNQFIEQTVVKYIYFYSMHVVNFVRYNTYYLYTTANIVLCR